MAKPVRLLAVHQGGGLGGAPVSLVHLLAGLDRDRLDPSVVFTEPGDVVRLAQARGVPARIEETGGALFYSAHARPGLCGLARFARTYGPSVRQAQRVLRSTRPDLLHLNTSVLLAWGEAARRERVPVVWMVREVLGPQARLRSWQAAFIQQRARRVVAISGAVRTCFPENARVAVVPNAVDLDACADGLRLSPREARRALGLEADTSTIMALGSVQVAKGHWLLLDALAQVVKHEPRARLVLVCGGVGGQYAGSWRGRLKRLLRAPLDNLDALLADARRCGLASHIVVTGYRTDIPRVLRAADVLVFPSLLPEGFGRPLIEAMAMQVPVVATDVGPSREILGKDAGSLVPCESGALAGALGRLLDAPDERARMGRAGRARVESTFGLEAQIAAMSDVYEEALRGSGR